MEKLLLENALWWQAAGFVACFVLLFYFIAKYRASLSQDEPEEEQKYPLEDLAVMTVSKPEYPCRASVLENPPQPSALETADLKEQIKELHYHLEEYKLTQDKNNSDYQKQLAQLEQRLSTFEQEYVNKLQPTLVSLIEELENMKVSSPSAVSDTVPASEYPAEPAAVENQEDNSEPEK